MPESLPSRRAFLATSSSALAAHWIALSLPTLSMLAGCARRAAESGAGFAHLTAAEAGALTACAERILPAVDGRPGATEAGAVHFIDAAIGGPFTELDEPVRTFARELDTAAGNVGSSVFAELAPEEQDALLAGLDASDGFEIVRMLVIMGVFADPSYGGNRNHAGSRMLGVRHAAAYRPPFGWYDDPANAEHA